MKRIETARWIPSLNYPGKLEYGGQRTAQEVFEELSHRLKNSGHFPDEYFLLNMEWENGKKFPENWDIYCITDYGASEGIYTDVYLRVYDGEKVSTERFATGKTLGESEHDLDRMNLIASAITKAFHLDGEHARYIKIEETEKNATLAFMEKQGGDSCSDCQEKVQPDFPDGREYVFKLEVYPHYYLEDEETPFTLVLPMPESALKDILFKQGVEDFGDCNVTNCECVIERLSNTMNLEADIYGLNRLASQIEDLVVASERMTEFLSMLEREKPRELWKVIDYMDELCHYVYPSQYVDRQRETITGMVMEQ